MRQFQSTAATPLNAIQNKSRVDIRLGLIAILRRYFSVSSQPI
jgi:hypothetical protein